MFIGYAIAGGMPQTVAPDPIAWYWLALAAIGIGVLISFSITQGIKTWRKEHKNEPLLNSTVHLFGRLFALCGTFIAWAVIATFEATQGSFWLIGGGLGLVSAGMAPWMWEHAMKLLKIVKPDWVKRLSAQ